MALRAALAGLSKDSALGLAVLTLLHMNGRHLPEISFQLVSANVSLGYLSLLFKPVPTPFLPRMFDTQVELILVSDVPVQVDTAGWLGWACPRKHVFTSPSSAWTASSINLQKNLCFQGSLVNSLHKSAHEGKPRCACSAGRGSLPGRNLHSILPNSVNPPGKEAMTMCRE